MLDIPTIARKPNPIDVHVGSRIRLRRNLVGMSQEVLAGHLGVTFQQVQKYEKGTNRVGASRLQMIAGALNVPVSFFFEEAPTESSPTGENDILNFARSGEGIELNRLFASIGDPVTRTKLLGVVKAVAALSHP